MGFWGEADGRKRVRAAKLWAVLLLAALVGPGAVGAEAMLSRNAFRELAVSMAQKVPLFRATWEADPEAAFFGGTVRDYLLWLAGRVEDGARRNDLEETLRELNQREIIDHREFIAADSDVDIFSNKGVALDASRLSVKRVDVRSAAALDPMSDEAKTHRDQGFLPAEKLVLRKDSVESLDPSLGDGLEEIRLGKYTVTFAEPEVFWKTHFAAKGWNHPVFLALRYVRILSADAYHRRGANTVGLEAIRERLDEPSMAKVEAVFADAFGDTKLSSFAKAELFHRKLDDTIQRAFSGYCDATVAVALHNRFKTQPLFRWLSKLTPINQHLFAKRRDPAVLEENWKKYRVNRASFFVPRDKAFPDGMIYHGTGTVEKLNDIAVRGILPSVSGSAGDGLYGSPLGAKQKVLAGYALNQPDHVVGFEVSPAATIVDITQGHGREVWLQWSAEHGDTFSNFCEAMGIDLLRYPYGWEAYVVKNARALGPPRTPAARRSMSDLFQEAETANVPQDFATLAHATAANKLSSEEQRGLLRRTPYLNRLAEKKDFRAYVRAVAAERLDPDLALLAILHGPYPEISAAVAKAIKDGPVLTPVRAAVDRFAAAAAFWSETGEIQAFASAIIALAVVSQRTPVVPANLAKLLEPLRPLLGNRRDIQSVLARVAQEELALQREEIKKLRSERWKIHRKFWGGATAVASVVAGLFAAMWGYDWFMNDVVGWTHGHIGVLTTAIVGGAYGIHAWFNRKEIDDFFIASLIAGGGFLIDGGFALAGLPQWDTGIAVSFVGTGLGILSALDAKGDLQNALNGASGAFTDRKHAREVHLAGVENAVRSCGTELAAEATPQLTEKR